MPVYKRRNKFYPLVSSLTFAYPTDTAALKRREVEGCHVRPGTPPPHPESSFRRDPSTTGLRAPEEDTGSMGSLSSRSHPGPTVYLGWTEGPRSPKKGSWSQRTRHSTPATVVDESPHPPLLRLSILREVFQDRVYRGGDDDTRDTMIMTVTIISVEDTPGDSLLPDSWSVWGPLASGGSCE